MLIAMAGLPGTGKSTLAARLADALGGVVLSKDVARSALFPPPTLDYSAAQDDVAMAAVFAAARLLLADPDRVVILDGRTFSKASQVAALLSLGREVGQEPVVIECVCGTEVAAERLRRDAEIGRHPAGNRDAALHARVKAAADPLTVPRLVLDTGDLTPDACLDQALEYVRGK